MYLLLTASKDTYITDKILESRYRVEDANVGYAGTLDLFKLYDESYLSGSDTPIELSRLLIKFNTDTLKTLTSSILNINDSSFKCYIKMSNVNAGQFTPNNFIVNLYPLSQSWDEGQGRDVNAFSDLDVANFLTSSYTNGTPNIWHASGANGLGLLGSDDIDIIGCGSLGSGVISLVKSQTFVIGNEDLCMDVTNIVSATMTSQLPDVGWRLSLTQAEETNTTTYFVKRFASRHVSNKNLQPKLHVFFDDSIRDNYESFYFDMTGSLFLRNYVMGQTQNIKSGSALTELSGNNCLKFIITTGSYYTLSQSVSSYDTSTDGTITPGLYSVSFCIPYSDQTLVASSSSGTSNIYNFAFKSGSITFDTKWQSNDGTVIFHTGTLTVKSPYRASSYNITDRPIILATNIKNSYKTDDKIRIRIFAYDNSNRRTTSSKVPVDIKSVIYDYVYYQIIDSQTGDIVIPFERQNNGTRVSTDSTGMYFDLFMSSLNTGRNYKINFLILDAGREFVDTTSNINFRVDP